ncbi:MAG: hypothetical protein ACO3SY_07890 [Flavobacteriaceae bacterium]
MSRYLTIINFRTFITLFISIAIPFVAYRFDIVYNIDLTLISIAIIFPLVFTIRGAFKRREKALQFLSGFRAGLQTVSNLFQSSLKENEAKSQEASNVVLEVENELLAYLRSEKTSAETLDQKIQGLYDFLDENTALIRKSSLPRLVRFINEVSKNTDNLIGVHNHRTPISLKAYCLIFIYIFPLIYTPSIINKIGFDNPEWLTYFIVILSQFILISLYNIQDQMEYPFDDNGLDDIKLNLFMQYRKH